MLFSKSANAHLAVAIQLRCVSGGRPFPWSWQGLLLRHHSWFRDMQNNWSACREAQGDSTLFLAFD